MFSQSGHPYGSSNMRQFNTLERVHRLQLIETRSSAF